MAHPARGFKFGLTLLLLFALLLGMAASVQAAEKFCSEYGGVIDGDVLGTSPVQITIDQTCTFQNWPRPNPLTATINFQTNDPSIYLIIFDNVWYDGNMACSNIDHKLWVVNSEEGSFAGACQDIMIPAETIAKKSPAPYAAVGVPFTYTLTLPSMTYPAGEPSPNDLGSIEVRDDLAATGADLTMQGLTAYYRGSGTAVPIVNLGDNKNLHFTLPNLPTGEQIVVEVTAVLDDTPANQPGVSFTNTATWQFSRWIDLNENGLIEDNEFFNPLPGESGISEPMVIVEPELVVNKTSDETALNLGVMATFTIDVQNTGGGEAWDATIIDELPVLPTTGMCDYDPIPTLTAEILAADGITPVSGELQPGTDFTLSYSGCELSLTMQSEKGVIGPSERLRITYQSQLDLDTDPGADGIDLTNVAGVTRWFNGDSSNPDRLRYDRILTDGTPLITDHQDSQTVTTALAGYYFQKIVRNLTSQANPAATAAPGDTLRYKLRLFNISETINGLAISDPLDPAGFDLNSFAMVTPPPAGAEFDFDPVTGLLEVYGSPDPFNLIPPAELVVEFDITLKSTLASGSVVSNQAELTAGSLSAASDDPYVNGIAPPGEPADPTRVVIQTPGPLAKATSRSSVTIGEQFTYTITVPAEPTAANLYDVRILDNLAASAADLRFIGARVVSGDGWALSNTSGSDTNPVIEDTITGIDIPSGSQAVIEITVELLNTPATQSGLIFDNTASYTYNRVNGVDDPVPGGAATSPGITVVEPEVAAAAKTVSFVSPADKSATDPATVGDILEYTVTVPNSGGATAFDLNLVDTLPATVALVPGSAAVLIDGVAVPGFISEPTTLSDTGLVWGRENGDSTLDIPVGQALVLTYQVTVLSAAEPSIVNRVYVDWTSLPDADTAERTGEGCPAWIAPNDYCRGPATVAVSTLDNTFISKAVLEDSYAETPAAATDPAVRVGDTVTYDLTLNLQEYTTRNIAVEDALPPGMALDSFSIIAGPNFSYPTPLSAEPAAGATTALRWEFGDIVNQPSSDATPIDPLVIRYVARVVSEPPPAGVAYDTSILRDNLAKLSYTGGDPALYPDRLTAAARVEVRQPRMAPLTKADYGANRVGTGSADDPYLVEIAADTMQFRLETCNAGLAPAYNLLLGDQLPGELNEESIIGPVVKIGPGSDPAAAAVAPATDYTYTLSGGRMSFAFSDDRPIDPNECVFVEYEIGFAADIPPDTLWQNSARVDEYYSLPGQAGRIYVASEPAAVYMRNVLVLNVPTKAIALPVAPANTVTIGEEVQYTITVPGAPVNAALSNVEVLDILDPVLDYLGATIADSLVLTDNTAAGSREVSLTIAEIPAGRQAVITLRARVANDATPATDAGDLFTNLASYVYGGVTWKSAATEQLTIVEPLVTVEKTVAPETAPKAGDLLTYTVVLAAAPGPIAYDLELTDTLSPGLTYEPLSANLGEPTITGDAVSGQTLAWSAGLDIAPGTPLTVTYQVRVNGDVVIGQPLTNTATARWTSLAGDHPHERSGTGTAPNDYVASASTTLVIGDETTFSKVRADDTYNGAEGDVRIGDLIEYELRLGLQEGSHPGVVVSDTLPAGLRYVEMVSASYFGTIPAIPPAPSLSGPTLTWNLGTVENPADGDAENDLLVLRYRVRVLNDNTLAQSPISQTLTNSATLAYTVGGTGVTRPDGAGVTVLQPMLGVSKSAAPANGDSVVDAGEIITYTVDIVNNGAAPAYDTRLLDTLPVGLRQGGVSTSGIILVDNSTSAETALAIFDPAYSSATGGAVWNFDTTTPDAYTIPPDHTLRVSYTVSVDSDVAAGLTLTNTAQAANYYSFDNDEVPVNGSVDYRGEYASAPAQAAVTTSTPGALSKATTRAAAAIGEEFTYLITVPAAPVATALNDVRIYDNLAAAGADLRFIGAEVVSAGSWSGTLTGSVNAGLVEIRADSGAIAIGPNEQLNIAVTVALLDTERNMTPGLSFTNRAWYTYSNGTTPLGDDAATGATSDSMTVAHPEMTLSKSGPVPATMRIGTPATFTLDAQNSGESEAWQVTLTDWLPDPVPGGMCDAGVNNISATIYQADGTTPVLALNPGEHYDTAFTLSAALSRCELVLTTKGAAVVAPGQRLIVTFESALDEDNIDATTLTNIAGATQWLSADPAGDIQHIYDAALTDGTVGTVDHQDAYQVTVQGAVLSAEKTVTRLVADQEGTLTELPGSTANPGDRLRYTITIRNTTDIPLNDFSLGDELDSLNAAPMFQANSIGNVEVPAGATYTTSDTALNVHGLDIGPNESLTVVFEALLVPVIDSTTVVLNQGRLELDGVFFGQTDDPALPGALDPTATLIESAPVFEVWKTSEDMSGDPDLLLAGDILRYTITVRNIGNENAVNTVLRDQIPVNTSYLPGSTTLNGSPVADPAAGPSPLQEGLPINAPEDETAGAMRADPTVTGANQATVTFDVVIDGDAVDGAIIVNQGFVDADGAGGGPQPEEPSDDPATPVPDDPTRNVVGALPLVDAHKTVQILVDHGSSGIVDPGDVLRYTIAITNAGATPAHGVVFIDPVPADTTYVADSVRLNDLPAGQPDGGISPLIAGIAVSSSDLTPPLPGAGNGVLSPGSTAVIVFDVEVNAGVAPATVISNQGTVETSELPDEPTDADGIDSNGDQPTQIMVGDLQLLSVTKEVTVIGGGAAVAGGELEYLIRATNIGSLPATRVAVTDDLAPLAGQVSYVAGSGRLNGAEAGIGYAASRLTADYGAIYGELPPGASAVVRFRVRIETALPIGTTIANTGVVSWSDPVQSASATVSLDLGGTPGNGSLSGSIWHDVNLDKLSDPDERRFEGWSVELYGNNRLLATVPSDSDGGYRLSGLIPNQGGSQSYELRFRAPDAGAGTPSLGTADSSFSNGPQRISGITVASGENLQNLNLPLWPNGTVYNSVVRVPVAGARLTMLNGSTGAPLADRCFDDPVQQDQVTAGSGFYKFDLNFSDASCPAGSDYLIEVTPPATGFEAGPSRIIPPGSDAATTSFSVPACPGSGADAIPATAGFCEVVDSAAVPPLTVVPGSPGTNYHLNLLLSDGAVPGQSQIFNNLIPIDPELNGAVAIAKTSSLINVSRGTLVPYTITVTNVYGAPLYEMGIVDRFPAGFKYLAGSARLDGKPSEPRVNGRELVWDGLPLQANGTISLQLLLVVGAGVSEGEYVNRAQVFNTATTTAASGEAVATVRVVPDPDFDCTDVIGKVFDDRNLNGRQDRDDHGLAGVRVVTARGLIATTDSNGRFHLTCAAVPDHDRGSNFILKVDERSLPSGYRLTTENPRVQRATRGKMIRFNFGAAIHRVVRIDIADGVFEPDSSELRLQWQPTIGRLIEELRKAPSVLHLSYLADLEPEDLVRERVDSLKKTITDQWRNSDGGYLLAVEKDIFWRRGAPRHGRN
ncbi:MAG: isopeptide-forming domain-containing fimbrial protein [Desulfurivibrionaceae bacterium]